MGLEAVAPSMKPRYTLPARASCWRSADMGTLTSKSAKVLNLENTSRATISWPVREMSRWFKKIDEREYLRRPKLISVSQKPVSKSFQYFS